MSDFFGLSRKFTSDEIEAIAKGVAELMAENKRLRDFLAELSRDAEFAQRHSYAGELYAPMKFASETRKKIRSVIESKEADLWLRQ